MRHLFLICTFLFTSLWLDAQSAPLTVYGQVTDSATSEPLPGVSVSFRPGNGTTTDMDGNYSLSVREAYFNLTYGYIGYDDKVVTVSAEGERKVRVDVQLTFSAHMLDQVVVSAGRFEQKASEVTVSMEVLRPELLQNKNVTTMDQALQETPGMVIVDNEPQIRSGSGFSFGAGSRVQILVDGIPQLSGDAGRATWQNLPIETIEQVEVIKGASSVLYGSSALSGVVHIRTTIPKGEPLTKISYYMGGYAAPRHDSANYWGGGNQLIGQNIMHAARVGNVDIIGGLMLLSDDGHLGLIQDTLGNLAPRGIDEASHYGSERRARLNLSLGVRNKKVDGLTYGLNLNGLRGNGVSTLIWGDSDDGLYSSFAGSATTTLQQIFNVNPYLHYFMANGTKLILRGNYQELNNDNDNGQGNFSKTSFAEAQYQMDFDSLGIHDLKLTSGLVMNLSDSDSELYSNGGTDPTHSASNLGAYLQADKKLFDRLNISAGMRFERFEIDETRDEKPVFRAGVNYELTSSTFLRASYGQGFRFPSIGEKFISTAVGLIQIYPNPELRAESSENIELAVKQGFALGDFVGYADLALFQQNFDNFIEFTFGQWADTATFDNLLGLGFTSLNTGDARVRGAEISIAARGKVGRQNYLSMLAGYTYTDPVALNPTEVYRSSVTEGIALADYQQATYLNTSSNPSDDVLKYRMRHLARFNMDYQSKRTNIGFGLRYNSFVENIDAVFEDLDESDSDLSGLLPSGVTQWRKDRNKGDLIMDARCAYDLTEQYRIGLVVNNLFNREYTIRPVHTESNRLIQFKIDMTIQ